MRRSSWPTTAWTARTIGCPAEISIDSEGTVRFANAYAEDEVWRDIVAAVHDEVGDAILSRLPPDTHICAATGVVTIDPDIEPWW